MEPYIPNIPVVEVHTDRSRTIVAEESSNLRRVEVELRFDAEFFGLLQNDVISLDNIQTREQKTLIDKIQALSTSVAAVAK